MATFLFEDINPNGSSFPNQLTTFNNSLYFVADNGDAGEEIWRTDGTSAGTVLLRDIDPNDTSVPESLTVVGDTLFFTAHDGVNGFELWKTDGTTDGTNLVVNLDSEEEIDFLPNLLTAVDSTLFFINRD